MLTQFSRTELLLGKEAMDRLKNARVRFQTASLSFYFYQAIAKRSPAPAAAYTVGRAITQNYEFIGIHFCLFR